MSLLTTPAILLRAHPYSETSQILRFFTEARGVMGAVARGVRKVGGRRGGALSTFAEGVLSVQFKETRDLQTYRDFSASNPRRGLAQDPIRLAAASVLGELILHHAESEGNPELFWKLGQGLDTMEREGLELLLPTLLVHLWSLIRELGFAPLIHECVHCGNPHPGDGLARFDFGAGGLSCASCKAEMQGPRLGPIARAQLGELVGGSAPPDLVRPRAHLRLASDFITYHISGGTPLRSMAVLADLTKSSHA